MGAFQGPKLGLRGRALSVNDCGAFLIQTLMRLLLLVSQLVTDTVTLLDSCPSIVTL